MGVFSLVPVHQNHTSQLADPEDGGHPNRDSADTMKPVGEIDQAEERKPLL
jgi:hypothetical protein